MSRAKCCAITRGIVISLRFCREKLPLVLPDIYNSFPLLVMNSFRVEFWCVERGSKTPALLFPINAKVEMFGLEVDVIVRQHLKTRSQIQHQ